MQIRKLTHDELPIASALCLSAFMWSVAPSLCAQGVQTFAKVAAAQALAERMAGDNLMLVFVADGQIAGLIELKQGRHVAMLFVAPGWQRRGIGLRLINAALEQAVGEVAGLVYQPMEKQLG